MKELRIILKNTIAVGWNTLYKTPHWTIRRDLAAKVHDTVRAALIDMGIHPFTRKFFFEERVNIFISAYFAHSPLDPDNIAAKLYIDGLKMIVLHEDSMEYVGRVSTQSFIDRKNPRVEILIQTVM